jgi:hypothetical protein
MSTTASIFKKRKVPYTVIGGHKVDRIRKSRAPLAVLLLNRGSRFYREEKLRQLQESGIGEILCVEGPRLSHDVEGLSREFPEIRFLLLQDSATPGERINIGIDEARTRLVLVMWSDMSLETSLPEHWEAFLGEIEEKQILCTVPRLVSSANQTLPSIQVPALIKGKLKVMPWKPVQEGMPSLFPFDYSAIYHRGRFSLSGGFDPWMGNPYWQKLDFGLRSLLWGERILCRKDMVVRYEGGPETEDSSADVSYKLFFLKNLAVRFNGEMGVLPLSRRFAYCLRSDSGWLEARNEFREVQTWVHQNRYRFKSDVQSLVNHWEIPE